MLPVPDANSSRFSLRVRYPRQPSRLVPVAECALVSSVASNVITVAAVPSAWGAAETVDTIQGVPHADALGLDQSATISGSDITIAAGVSSELAAGDYVTLAGETCVPPVPEVVWPALTSATSVDVLTSIGDEAHSSSQMSKAGRQFSRAKRLLTPRNRGEREVIQNHNSAARAGRFPNWRGY